MAQTRGTFAALYDNIDKTITALLRDRLRELAPIWRRYFNVDTSTRKFERSQLAVPFGDVPEKGEGDPFIFDLIRQGPYKDFTHVEFGLGFEITQTASEDDVYRVVSKAPQWLAFSARVVEEKRAARIFNNGFSTETTADGLSVFNSAHTLGGGGTARNILSTAADLSATSLTQALVDLQTETKIESGQVVAVFDSLVLLVPPALEFLADRLLNSIGLPQSADNDRNPIKTRRNWTLIVNPYLTDSDAWFVLAGDKSMHGIKSYTRIPITQEPPVNDPRTGNRLYKLRFRRSWGCDAWQGAFGTPGA